MPDLTVESANGPRFTGKAALVTGAAGGIGLAIAHRLTGEGCSVMLTDIDASRLHKATAELSSTGADVASEVADISVSEQRHSLISTMLERWGRIDVLINNAAYHGPRVSVQELPEEEWERVFSTNVFAAAGLGRAAATDMLNRRAGAIVNIASIQYDLPVPTYSAYVSSKGAILALTRSLAVELSPSGIRVNAVAPGVIATEAFRKTLARSTADAAQSREFAPPSAALLGRHGHPEEVAAAVAFLASSDASFVTGAVLYVDGGRRISRRPDPFDVEFRSSPHQAKD